MKTTYLILLIATLFALPFKSLAAGEPGADLAVDSYYTMVCTPPISGFTYSANNLSINFSDQSDSGTTSWLWDFGDGNISTSQNPSHTFASAGDYQVCLTAINACGDADSSCQTITICSAPVASFIYSANNLSINFSDQSGSGTTSWLWDFGDGNISTSQNPSHTFASAGDYQVCLTAINACGDADSSCQTITICLAPAANFTYTGNFPTISFSDQSSVGNIAWFWDFGDGSLSTLQNPSHTYANAGTYEVCLIAYNSCGDSDTICQQLLFDPNSLSEVNTIGVEVYPNPTSDVLQILFSEELNNVKIVVTDLAGNTIHISEHSGTSVQLSSSNWASGCYNIRILHDSGTALLKVIKE